jgi:hypothetical protein
MRRAASRASTGIRVSFCDDEPQVKEIPLVPEEAAKDVWFTPRDIQARKSNDTILVKACVMGTIPSEVCIRGLESKIESAAAYLELEEQQYKYNDDDDNNFLDEGVSGTSRRRRVVSLVETLLQEQERQRQRKMMTTKNNIRRSTRMMVMVDERPCCIDDDGDYLDGEEILAQACRRQSEGCKREAHERGLQDSLIHSNSSSSTSNNTGYSTGPSPNNVTKDHGNHRSDTATINDRFFNPRKKSILLSKRIESIMGRDQQRHVSNHSCSTTIIGSISDDDGTDDDEPCCRRIKHNKTQRPRFSRWTKRFFQKPIKLCAHK